ncbi:hypothetical protein [Streptomyces fungicidicus]|uniref:hypothetical protein n=1 Tax=Streptomyces fungicidicus TaxID=68203 RepID=UPI0036961AD2
MAWDELCLQQWADPHDLIAHLVVLAARNSDVDALNLGAQAMRREAGELGDEHTYALPGGDTLTLAVGDIVRVRENDYRSRRDQGPDMLNGYRAVITAMDEHHRVEITWRVKDAKAPGGHRTESGWVSPQKVAGGALSLGYAMTIAASQGLTCNTSLMYGHGANAFATYPGITRARRQNHLWLPLAVLEDEQTRARLGESRSEKERLERAIDAFARFLGQSRPDGIVSDLLQEPPAPAPLPRQRDLSAEEARAGSERRLRQSRMAQAGRAKSVSLSHRRAQDEAQREEQARRSEEKAKQLLARIQAGAEERAVPSWTKRIYGAVSPQELNRLIAEGDRLATDAEAEATEAETQARELAARLDHEKATSRPTRGQRFAAEAGEILDQATAHVSDARGHLETAFAAAGHAEDRARQLAKLAESEGKGRIALRLAGTSLKEYRELTQSLTGERAAYLQTEADAKRDARQALREARDVVQHSRFADSLGVARTPVPDHVEKAAERLVEMRSIAERAATAWTSGTVTPSAAPPGRRASSGGTPPATAPRQPTPAPRRPCAPRSPKKFPELYDREATGRHAHQQAQQAQQAAQHQQAAVAHPEPTRFRGRGLR